MSNIIEIKNLSFRYDNNVIYDNFSLNIKDKTINHIIDCENNGKTTLAKILSCELKTNASIKINGMDVNQQNVTDIKKSIVTIYENTDRLFISDTIINCIYLVLKSKGISKKEADLKIEELNKTIDINHLLYLNPSILSGGQKQLVAFFCAIIQNPKILIIDNGMVMLDNVTKEKIYTVLKKLREQGTTIIHFTANSEDLLLGTDIIIINNGKVLLNTSIKKAFNKLDTYTENNIKLPFVIELSSKLMYYKTIDKIYFDYKKLVEDLWN